MSAESRTPKSSAPGNASHLGVQSSAAFGSSRSRGSSVPYYQDDCVTIYHGDWRDQDVWGFDAVVADPPYGINLETSDYRPGLDHAPISGDDEPFDPKLLLAFGVPTILWGANNYCHRLPATPGWLAWNKVLYDGAAGTQMMNKRQADVELAWTNFLRRSRSLRHLWDGVYRDSEHGTRLHPAQKPVALMSWCLQLLPDTCKVVFDPYMGCGPTLRAAKDLGLKAIGCELEERYCEVAVERMAQEVLAV